MKNYTEVSVKTTHAGSELVADLLAEFTNDGVAVSDAQDVIDLERSGKNWDYADDGVYLADRTVTVKVYIPAARSAEMIADIKNALAALKNNSPFDLGELSILAAEVDGDLWREKWKENFKPLCIGKTVIVPAWIDYKAAADETVVLLDSNMAFGTGEHETTFMCVEFLQKYVKPDDTVIDVGCGSGILGITASKLGADKVIMTDIDECATTAAEHNVDLNGVKNAEIYLKNLLDDNSVKGDVIVANIVAEVLIGFAAGLKCNLNAGGTVILSGILIDRLQKVTNAYRAQGFTLIDRKIKGEWAAIVLKGEGQRL
ncbi:MAG: 50S ribosomal protein L11 methyltransferase [Clostridia bacterium]|nr:50S ribosomal protein L11 methyltransferase [Clostridia bacterium]